MLIGEARQVGWLREKELTVLKDVGRSLPLFQTGHLIGTWFTYTHIASWWWWWRIFDVCKSLEPETFAEHLWWQSHYAYIHCGHKYSMQRSTLSFLGGRPLSHWHAALVWGNSGWLLLLLTTGQSLNPGFCDWREQVLQELGLRWRLCHVLRGLRGWG